MTRITILFNDGDNYISVVADEFHEDDGFLKAYSARHELVALADLKSVKCAYKTEDKTR